MERYECYIIGSTLPISSAEAERSFSGLRRIKSYLRNRMSEKRFSGLARGAKKIVVKLDIMCNGGRVGIGSGFVEWRSCGERQFFWVKIWTIKISRIRPCKSLITNTLTLHMKFCSVKISVTHLFISTFIVRNMKQIYNQKSGCQDLQWVYFSNVLVSSGKIIIQRR